MREFTGTFIGGPMARQSLTHHKPLFEMIELASGRPTAKPERYYHLEVQGVGLWLLEGTTAMDAVGELVLDYQQERPHVRTV